MAGRVDPDAPLREPVRIGNRYPTMVQPLTTVRHLLAFAQWEAERRESGASDWQRVYEELLRAETPVDLTLAVARFKATADAWRWLGR